MSVGVCWPADFVDNTTGAIEHEGFEEDVGVKSDFRIVYHSTAPKKAVSCRERVLHLLTRVPEDLRSFIHLHSSWPEKLHQFSGACPGGIENDETRDNLQSPRTQRSTEQGSGGAGKSVLLVSPWFVEQLRREMDPESIEGPWPSAGLIGDVACTTTVAVLCFAASLCNSDRAHTHTHTPNLTLNAPRPFLACAHGPDLSGLATATRVTYTSRSTCLSSLYLAQHLPDKSIPCTALAWARQHCSSVDTYGFGGGQPGGAWHYWEEPEAQVAAMYSCMFHM